MSSIGKLKDLTKNTVLSQGIEIIGNFYSVLTATNGYISIQNSIKDVESQMLSYIDNANHPEYQLLQEKHKGLINEQAFHTGVLITSFKDLANSVIGIDKDHKNFENLGTASTRLVANSAILLERFDRGTVGKDGKQIDLSLGVAVMADLANVIGSLGETYDDLINKKTAGLGKTIPKPWLMATKVLDGVGDSLTTIANNLVDAQGNSKIVYYLGIEELLPKEPELYKELHEKNSTSLLELRYAFTKGGFIQHAIQNIEDNMVKMLDELIESWKQLIPFIDDDQGVIYYGEEGNDTFFGTNDNDYLNGKGGNDTLDGEKGNDHLEGGQGYDTYHIKDHDTIYDADGKGKILFDGKALPKEFIRHFTTDIWYAKDSQGNILYTAIKDGDNLNIHSEQSPTDKVTITDFFLTTKATGTTYSALSIVLGDSKEEINKEGIYTIKTDDKLHANVYAGAFPSEFIEVIGSDKIDWINAGNVNKQLDVTTEGGNDFIFGGNMGDVIKAGVGNDVIYGSSGFYDFADESKLPKPEKEGEGIDEDLLIGGAGNDLISGGLGNDIIWADDLYKGDGKTPLHKDTNNPNNKNNPSEKGDWILGGRGNDFIHGSTNNDFLQGGADKDTIYGGGGNDVILGDGHIRFGNRTQTITSESTISYDPTLIGSGMISTTPTIHHGATLSMEYNYDNKNDKELNTKQQFVNLRDHRVFSWDIEIDTEQGDYKFTKQKDIALTDDYHILDEKFSENTSDLLYGGAGNDLIIGQYGNDYIDGGAGNDIIYGDDNRNPDIGMTGGQLVNIHDTLKGGTGLDKLLGGLGEDTYLLDLEDLATSNDNKIIEDSDSRGMLVVGGTSWNGKVWTRSTEQENIYLDGQGNTLQKQGSDYVITSTNFVASISIQKTTLINDTLLGMTLKDTPPDEPKPDQPEAPKPNTPPPAPETPPSTPTTGNPATPEAPITADPNTPITPIGADPSTPSQPKPPTTEPTTPTTPTPIDPVAPTPPPSTPTNPIAVIPPAPTYNPNEKGKTLWGSLGHDNLMGDDKANTLLGLLGDDVLNGGLGHDKLYGDLGHDILIGGKDDDRLEGGFGNDVYLYAKGDGKDTIKDIGGLDMLKITGLSLSDLGFVKQGDHLFIDTNLNDNSTNEGIFIENYFQKSLIDMMTGKTPTPTIERLYVDDKLVSHHEINQLTQIL